MRWKPLSYYDLNPIHWLWMWLPLLGLIILLAPLFAAEWFQKKKRAAMGPSENWRPWFAWYPVITNVGTVWFE